MRTIVSIIGSLLSISLSAQIYHPFQTSSTNPNWSMAFWIGPGDTPDFFWYEINSDTVIGINTYGKVESHYGAGSFYYEGALRESGQQVYLIPRDSVDEMLIYDFSKQVDDTLFNIWCYPGEWVQDTFVVTDVDSIQLGANYYNRYTLSNLGEAGYLQWIESIGSTGDLLRHFPYLSVSGQVYLTCFHNNAGAIYTYSQTAWIGSSTCFLNTEQYQVKWLETYPNPAEDVLWVDYSELNPEDEYQIMNLHGQTVLTGRYNDEGRMMVTGLKPGIYLVNIKSGKNIYLAKFIKN